jgi:hypothetical protein
VNFRGFLICLRHPFKAKVITTIPAILVIDNQHHPLYSTIDKPLLKMAHPAGLEPATI